MSASRPVRIGAVVAGIAASAALFATPALATHGDKHAAEKAPKAIGPRATAWFDTTRVTEAQPGLPQPGVSKHDLVVDGATIDTGQLPVPTTVTVPVVSRVAALAAMSFTLPKRSSAGTLRLDLASTTLQSIEGKLPGGVSPYACPTTSKWKAGAQQVGSAAPAYDCKKRKVIGQLSTDGKSIEFNSIGRLGRGRHLSFVILPGTIGLERLVFTKPGRNTLRVLSFSGPTTPATSPPSPGPTPSNSPPADSTGGDSSGFSSGGSSASLPPVKGAKFPNGSSAGTQPSVAGSSTSQPVLRASNAKPLDDHRARWAAIALLVGLIVGTVWLTTTDTAASSVGALRILGAIWAGGPVPTIPAREWGVGRFRSTRSGPPPTI